MKKCISSLLAFLMVLTVSLTLLSAPALAAETTTIMDINATAALLVEVEHDTILYEKNAKETRYPASITKVMTALLTVEAIEAGQLQQKTKLVTSETAVADITEDSSTQNIAPGEEMSVENLLYCLLTASANEAANILAEGVSGSIPAFVERMNERAAELGMEGTHFVNPHGLHSPDHYTTAYDIYLMCREALKHPLFQEIVATPTHTVPATNLSEARVLHCTNALVSSWRYGGYLYSYATGIKTGNTPEAGYCLASSAEKGGRTLIAVVLGTVPTKRDDGTTNRPQFGESRRLLQWGFSNFKPHTLAGPETLMTEVPVPLGKGVSYVVAHPMEEIVAVIPAPFDPELLVENVQLKEDKAMAPVKQGQVMGSVTVSYDGVDYGTADLVAVSDVERSTPKFILFCITSFFGNIFVQLGILVLAFFLIRRYLRGLRRQPRKKGPGKHQAPRQHRGAPR